MGRSFACPSVIVAIACGCGFAESPSTLRIREGIAKAHAVELRLHQTSDLHLARSFEDKQDVEFFKDSVTNARFNYFNTSDGKTAIDAGGGFTGRVAINVILLDENGLQICSAPALLYVGPVAISYRDSESLLGCSWHGGDYIPSAHGVAVSSEVKAVFSDFVSSHGQRLGQKPESAPTP